MTEPSGPKTPADQVPAEAELKFGAVVHPVRAKAVFAAHQENVAKFGNPLEAMQMLQTFMAIASAAVTADWNDNGQPDYKDLLAIFKDAFAKVNAFKANAPKLTVGNMIVETQAFTNEMFVLYNQFTKIIGGDIDAFKKKFPAVFGAI